MKKSESKSGVKCPKVFERSYRTLTNENFQFIRTYTAQVNLIDHNRFNELSSEELILQYQQGQAQFEHVLQRHLPIIISKSKQWVPGNYTFEDVFQDLVARLDHCAKRWNPDTDSKFITYLFKGLDNAVSWIFRKQNSENRIANNMADSYEFSLENGYDEVAPEDVDKQIFEILESVKLSERERVCVEMVIEGHQNKDIAKHFNLSPNRIGQILRDLAPKFQFLLDH